MTTVILTERTTASLPRELFRTLENSDVFVDLVEQGVVSLVRSRNTPYGARAASQVGQAFINEDIRLVVAEKVPGVLEAMLSWSLPSDLREAAAPSPVATGGPILEAFARRFLHHVRGYLGRGRSKAYRPHLEVTDAPRGRIAMRESVQLLARGKRGRLAHRRFDLTADTLPNRLVAVAIRAIFTHLSLTEHAADTVATARLYDMLFDDVDRGELRRWGRAGRAAAFDEALRHPLAVGDLHDALSYARALILHLGAWPEHEEWVLPRAYFIDLESLFEDAVRQVLTEVQSPVPVARGSALGRPLFADLPDAYVADPDFVVGEAPAVVLVGDCKYKDLEGRPAHSDVYQLVSHCSAFGSTLGLLVYPGQVLSIGFLGTTGAGVRVYWATIRPKDLGGDLCAVMDAVGPTGSAGLGAPGVPDGSFLH